MVFVFKIFRRIISALLIVIIIVPLYVAGQVWTTAHDASLNKVKPSDVIVILGAAQDNGVPTPILAERIRVAEVAYHQGLAPLIISVGGSQKGDHYTEAAASRMALIKAGIPKSRIVELGVGKDTLTSTTAYAAYMKIKRITRVIIATDPYHCFRAEAEARGFGLTPYCDPSTSGPGSLKSTGIRYVVRETGAYLAYETVGRFGIHLSDQIKN